MNEPFVRYIDRYGKEQEIENFQGHILLSKKGISKIEEISKGVRILSAELNHLTSLPDLPESLEDLRVRYNLISKLPPLPSKLKHLDCYDNILDSLPNLPEGLETLNCTSNFLRVLPQLPKSLVSLYLEGNTRLKGEINLNRLLNLEYLRIAGTGIMLRWDGINIPAHLSSLSIGGTILQNLRVAKKLKKKLSHLEIKVT